MKSRTGHVALFRGGYPVRHTLNFPFLPPDLYHLARLMRTWFPRSPSIGPGLSSLMPGTPWDNCHYLRITAQCIHVPFKMKRCGSLWCPIKNVGRKERKKGRKERWKERSKKGEKDGNVLNELAESIITKQTFCNYCVITCLVRNLICYVRECAIL